ncbi:MAG: 2'-5' RNA ligase family protein [Bryobacteraceae bacterium]
MPEPLAGFLDALRRELEPDAASPRAHLTLLPPRELQPGVSVAAAIDQLDRIFRTAQAVEIEIGAPEIFPGTNVVYLALRSGTGELREVHAKLNAGALEYSEPFAYHPHVTIAQGLTQAQAERVRDRVAELWARYRGPRGFVTESVTFVHNADGSAWSDLAEYSLPVLTGAGRTPGRR